MKGAGHGLPLLAMLMSAWHMSVQARERSNWKHKSHVLFPAPPASLAPASLALLTFVRLGAHSPGQAMAPHRSHGWRHQLVISCFRRHHREEEPAGHPHARYLQQYLWATCCTTEAEARMDGLFQLKSGFLD